MSFPLCNIRLTQCVLPVLKYSQLPGIQNLSYAEKDTTTLVHFKLFMGFSRQECWFAIPFSSGLQTVLPKELTGHRKHPLPTTQEMTLHMDITRRSIQKSDSLYSSQSKKKKIQSTKTIPRADCGSYHELIIALPNSFYEATITLI